MPTPADDPSPTDVLILTPQLSRAAGGVWTYLDGLVGDALPGNDVRVTLAGVAELSSTDWRSIRNAARVIAAPPTLVGSRYGLSHALGRTLAKANRFDVIHAQGLRTFAGRETLRLARRTGTPYLLTPHGMFHPQLRDVRSLKKSLIDAAWDRRYIERASCLHATSELELSILRDAGVRQPAAVIPIGVNVAARSDQVAIAKAERHALFLGILNRKKGLLRLIDAWSEMRPAGWSLTIAGPDDAGHRAEVEARVLHHGLTDVVTFRGPAWDAEKAALLESADLFVLPTDWENFGIVVAEALAARVPVITTTGAPWRSLQTSDSGWWVEPTVPALAAALRDAFAKSPAELRAMGERGRAMVEAGYAWPAIGRQMAAVYRWLAGRGDRPACVVG